MRLRRILPLAVLALAACPSVDRQDPPASIAVATFDSNTAQIPLPNDLALQRAPGIPPAPAATGLQRELLLSFVTSGGFPADQEVAVTIPITVKARQADGSYGTACPGVPTSRCGTPPAGLDLATVSDENVAFLRVDGETRRILRCASPVTAECFEPSYANGTLTLRRNAPDGSRRWPAGSRWVVALRAGAIRTTDGLAIGADAPIALVAQNKDLSNRENQPPGGLPDSNGNGSNADETATIEALRGTLANPRAWGTVADAATCTAALAAPVTIPVCWLPAPTTALPAAFDAVATVFPRDQIASIQTFTVQPLPQVRPITDSGSGTIPLPSDFLLDPSSGKVRSVAAFGPAAAGLATLDGFSTTAPLLIPLTGPVQASTITRQTARIYDLSSGAPVQLTDLTQFPTPPQIVTQPPTAVSNGLSTSVVLAPAVPVEAGLPQPVYVPPLKEKTKYLVVVTNGVKDAAGQPLRRSTLMDLVFSFNANLCEPVGSPTCTSRIPGIANADAAGLQALRSGLGPVLQALNLKDCSNNATCAVLAYTVTTQSVKDASVQLAAAPFSIESKAGNGSPAAVFVPAGATAFDTQAELGIPAAAFPNVAKFVQAQVPTFYAIQGTTGAFDPALLSPSATAAQIVPAIKPIPALVAIPTAAAVAAASACPAPNAALKCVPLVVFHHGLNGSRLQMLGAADALASKGFVVAAIDAPYHGDRAYCAQSSDCVVAGGGDGVCTPNPALQTPSDATAPGTCTTGTLRRNASLSTQASGNFFITSNFFRIRDGFRQDQLDHAALVMALARPPAGVPQPAQVPALVTELATTSGIAIDPREVRYAGISLGGIAGTSIAATNPRFKRVALNVPAGTLVDAFTTSPAFAQRLPPIFSSLGIDLACVQQGTGCDAATRAAQTARYAQTLALAKWILDPADPVNYAANVSTKVTPADPAIQGLFANLAAGGVASTTTEAYGQMVVEDQVLTNPYNRLLLNLSLPGRFTTYTPTNVDAAARHGLLLANFAATPAAAAGERIRQDLASFLQTATLPPVGAQTAP